MVLVFDPQQIDYSQLLKVFWESHDPTQGMRQGNDTGTQYRSAIYCRQIQLQQAKDSAQRVQSLLNDRGYGAITSEIRPAPVFYYARTIINGI